MVLALVLPLTAGTGTASAIVPPSAAPPLPKWDVTGYVEAGAGAKTAIAANRGAITSVGVDTSTITPAGTAITRPDRGALGEIRTIGALGEFLVSNWDNTTGGFSAALAARVLERPAHRRQVVSSIVADVASGHWNGVTIDFEELKTSDRGDLVTFVKDLRAALPAAKVLSIDVPASPQADDPYIAPYDDKQLARYVNEVVLMAYDEHYQGGPAGPVAGRPWVEACLAVARRSVPVGRLQLGEAGYGYRWYHGELDATVAVSDAQARQISARAHVKPVWSAEQGEWHVTLPHGSLLWWSDDRSMAIDTRMARAAHLRGTAVWDLQLSDPLPRLRG